MTTIRDWQLVDVDVSSISHLDFLRHHAPLCVQPEPRTTRLKYVVRCISLNFFQNNYDRGSISSSESVEGGDGLQTASGRLALPHNTEQETKPSEPDNHDPSMPVPPPDLSLSPTDILIIKYIGMTGVILAVIIICSQVGVRDGPYCEADPLFY